MPTYAKSEDWLHQSSLLLEARPETTRITTRYTIRPHRPRTPKSDAAPLSTTTTTTTTPAPGAPRGDLELKTYDPVSGVALKYRTVKLAEVGRLVQSLLGNQLGRGMAGVPIKQDVGGGGAGEDGDVTMGEAGAAGVEGSGVATPVGGEKAGGDKGAAGGGGGGKGKKKKGKR